MKKTCLILAFIMPLLGCATGNRLPGFPKFQMSNIHRVALFVETGNRMQHYHMGTTKLSNFTKEAPVSWSLDEVINKRFMKKLSDEGVEVVDLEDKGFNYFMIDKLIVAKEGKWSINPDYATYVIKLQDDIKVQAVVIVKGCEVATETITSHTGGRYPVAMATSSGLFSHYFLGINKKFKAIAAFEVKLFLLEPKADLSLHAPLEAQHYYRIKELKDFTPPKDITNISKEEFRPVIAAIDEYISDAADLVVCALKMGENPDRMLDYLPDKFISK